MSENNARARAYLSGRVQGVGMRAHVHSVASKLPVSGFVRNLRDGRVEVVAEGPRASLEKLIHAIKTGTYSSYIVEVSLSWEDPANEFAGFEIAY